MNIEWFGTIILRLGFLMVLFGGVLLLGGKIGLGRLPGDILVKKGDFIFYFPLVTGIIVSIVLSFVLNFILRR